MPPGGEFGTEAAPQRLDRLLVAVGGATGRLEGLRRGGGGKRMSFGDEGGESGREAGGRDVSGPVGHDSRNAIAGTHPR